MSRRHLESALVAGALLENNLLPVFRFTRVRFVRCCHPPTYEDNSPFRGCVTPVSETALSKTRCRTHSSGGGADAHHLRSQQHRRTGMAFPSDVCEGRQNHDEESDSNDENTYSDEDVEPYLTHLNPANVDSKRLVKMNTPHRMSSYDSTPLRLQARSPKADDFAVHTVQFSGDGQRLVAGSENSSIRLVTTVDGKQSHVTRPSKWRLGMPVTCLRFMPPKLSWVVGCTPHGDVFAFLPDKEGFETLFTEPQQTYCLDMSPDGKELATAGSDRAIRVYSLQTACLNGIQGDDVDCKSRVPHHYDAKDTAYTNSRFQHQNINDSSPVQSRRRNLLGGRPDQLVNASVQPYLMTQCFATPELGLTVADNQPQPAAYAPHAACHRPATCPVILPYRAGGPADNLTRGHSMRVMALRYHPTRPNVLISAAWDNTVKIWDTRLQHGPMLQINGPHVASPDGLDIQDNSLLTASWRATNSLEIWDMRVLSKDVYQASDNTIFTKNKPAEIPNVNGAVPTRPPMGGSCSQNSFPKSTDSLRVNQSSTANSQKDSGNFEFDRNCVAVLAVDGGGDLTKLSSFSVELVPVSGVPSWEACKAAAIFGEYPYAARLLPSRAIACAGSGFREMRVVSRDTLLPIARVPVDSVVHSMDSILDGRYIGLGCASGTICIIGLA